MPTPPILPEPKLRRVHVHLVSDATGDTVLSVSRAAFAQFSGVEATEHLWPMVRSPAQMERLFTSLERYQGIVLYTIADAALRNLLKEACMRHHLPCIPVLSRVLTDLSKYLDMQVTPRVGRPSMLDDDYFARVEALTFSVTHDDGQSPHDLNEADIILVGVSRTSKSPTSVYLAYRGFRVANVPFVRGCPLPEQLFCAKQSLVVGLSVQPERLVEVRKHRILSPQESHHSAYLNMEEVREEIKEARQLCGMHNWPMIDVTRRSVEETAATIIQWYYAWQEQRQTESTPKGSDAGTVVNAPRS